MHLLAIRANFVHKGLTVVLNLKKCYFYVSVQPFCRWMLGQLGSRFLTTVRFYNVTGLYSLSESYWRSFLIHFKLSV